GTGAEYTRALPAETKTAGESIAPAGGIRVQQGLSGDGFFQPLGHRLHQRVLVRERLGLELGVEQLAVDAQLEAPPAGRDHGELRDPLLDLGQEFRRQTDGLGLVVSDRTVFQLDLHRDPSENRHARASRALLLYGKSEDPAESRGVLQGARGSAVGEL